MRYFLPVLLLASAGALPAAEPYVVVDKTQPRYTVVNKMPQVAKTVCGCGWTGKCQCWESECACPACRQPARAVPAVAAPFVQGSGTTRPTTAPCAGGACLSSPAPALGLARTFTGAPLMVLPGGTSGGCANGSCGVPQQTYPAGGLFRRR